MILGQNNSNQTSANGIAAKGYAVDSASSPFNSFDFQRRAPRDDDVVIRIHFCGICHTDIHQTYNDWHGSKYPMVPGHEITGVVEQVGSHVKHLRVGDHVGVGCMVDSCLKCKLCKKDLEQYCADTCYTYNSTELDKTTPTYGGYSNVVTIKEHFVCKIPKNLPLDAAAPYSQLIHPCDDTMSEKIHEWVVGLGGLGHMAVKLGAAMGAHVTVISTSESKRADATKLGAKAFLLSKDQQQMKEAGNSLDLIIDTVSADHDVNSLLGLLTLEGVYCIVGAPTKPLEISAFNLIKKQPIVTGSAIGGMKETQEMLDFCGKHDIICDIEKIEMTPETLKMAYDRTMKADVRYRFVLDILNAFK